MIVFKKGDGWVKGVEAIKGKVKNDFTSKFFEIELDRSSLNVLHLIYNKVW